MRLRDAVGEVRLIDARTNGIAAAVRDALQLDFDKGMLVLYGGRAYYGADAMHVLAGLTSTSDRWNAAMAFIFRHPWLARLISVPVASMPITVITQSNSQSPQRRSAATTC
jgi:hypothetical protein